MASKTRVVEALCTREEMVMELQTTGVLAESHDQQRERDAIPEWEAVHQRLRDCARRRATLDAAEAYDLLRAEQLKLYTFCGFVSIYEYMERILGYGPHAAHERMRVARALAQLPATASAL
jgi:hypothetical protein